MDALLSIKNCPRENTRQMAPFWYIRNGIIAVQRKKECMNYVRSNQEF